MTDPATLMEAGVWLVLIIGGAAAVLAGGGIFTLWVTGHLDELDIW